MKSISILLILGFAIPACKAQTEPWSKTKNWKVYAGGGSTVFTVPTDSLGSIQNRPLDRDSVQFYLKQMQPLPKDRKPTWMGAWLGSYETSEGKLRKVEFGAYGGYFYDVSTDKYFALPRPLIRPWQSFIARNIPN
jgi:hypothetical protein